MTQFEKLKSRFLSQPKDFTCNELKRFMKGMGYKEIQGSGSRVVFSNETRQHRIKLHKPHPARTLKRYQIELIIKELQSKLVI